MICTLKSSSKRSITAIGNGEPPETERRRAGRPAYLFAASSSAMYMVGTPSKMVTL